MSNLNSLLESSNQWKSTSNRTAARLANKWDKDRIVRRSQI